MKVKLQHVAHTRSGDKGNTSNIGVIARRPEWLPLLQTQLTPQRVAQWLAHRDGANEWQRLSWAVATLMDIQFHTDWPLTRTTALQSLPGVGRKTANVVLNIAFGEPTIAVAAPAATRSMARWVSRVRPCEAVAWRGSPSTPFELTGEKNGETNEEVAA